MPAAGDGAACAGRPPPPAAPLPPIHTPPAEHYSYTLWSVRNPSVTDPATADPADVTEVATDVTITLADHEAVFGATSTFAISGLEDKLYIVVVKAHNPNKPEGVASDPSAVIGTGARGGLCRVRLCAVWHACWPAKS